MKKAIIITSICTVSSLIPLKTLAANFSQLYIFGDSLSDTGNTYKLTGNNIPPSPPYFQGNFSNGKVWTQYLATDLGLNPSNYADVISTGANPSQGINFAFGGATTGTENTLDLTIPNLPVPLPGLAQEIGVFTTNFASTADKNALYVIWAGANNYLPNQTNGAYVPQTIPNTAIANLSASIQALASVGAKNFLVVNLPDLAKLPLTVNQPGSNFLSQLSNEHNSQLKTTVDNLKTTLPVNFIQILDVNTLVNQVTSDSTKYGFDNVTQGCLTTACTTPDQYLFWDNLHPTTKGHELIAQLANNTLQSIPEPTTVLGLLSFSALTLRLRKKSA